MPGSGFVPDDLIGRRMGLMAAILAECTAYADFVGAEIAALNASGMYYDGIDRRDLLVEEDEVFPAAFVIWANDPKVKFYSTQGGGISYKFSGGITMTIEADTPAEFKYNTPAAYNWIREHASAMLMQMKTKFATGDRQDVESFSVIEGPYRSPEGDDRDYVSMTILFEMRT